MKEPTELVPGKSVVEDPRGALERPLPPYARYDLYPEGTSSGYNRLHEYWRSVRKHIWLVIIILAVVTSLTALYMQRQPDVYESLSRVQVDLETANNPAIGAMKGNSIFLNNPLQDPTYFNTQIQILTSAGLLGRVAKTLDLDHNQSFLNPQSTQHRSVWESFKGLVGSSKNNNQLKVSDGNKLRPTSALSDDVAETDHYEPYVERLQSELTVKQLNETRIIEIRFKHQGPEIAAKINNMIADTFVVQNLERKTETR